MVERADGVQEHLLSMQSKPGQFGGACLALEAVVDLNLDLGRESDATIPTEHCVKDLIEAGEFQTVWRRDQADHHRINVTENQTQNQSLEGCRRHAFSLRPTPDLVLLS
ncbi:MAG: hypothetical protein FJW39_31845 [Acidobacteria bacterium]|nr:hypothetical protein [Acidobacteriota bacterium]